MRAHPHERFSSEITLTPAAVREYAVSVGDTNQCTMTLVPQRRVSTAGSLRAARTLPRFSSV